MWVIFSTRGGQEPKKTSTPISKQTVFSTKKSPEAIGPYSKAMKAGNLLFCSGQIWLDPKTMELVEGWIESETKQVCYNIEGVLSEYGLGFKDVVKTTIFLKNMSDFQTVNDIYKNYFIVKPARSTVEVSNLPKNARIEIEVIAQYK